MALAELYRPAHRRQILIVPFRPPAKAIEYLFYAALFYSILGPAFNLSVPFAGVGMLVVLTAACVISMGWKARVFYRPLILPFAAGISFLFIQLVVHGESLSEPMCRAFSTWLLGMVLVQSLSVRPQFLHRFTLVMFVMGLVTLPYLGLHGGGLSVERASIGEEVSGNLTNANGLAEWFGFCAVYFVVFGLETKRIMIRIGSWLLAVACLYVVALTVSRGALLATALAITFAIQHLLKRGFIPILLLIVFTWIVFESGLFGQTTARYSARATEETGRFLVWPLALERFVDSPFVGVGTSAVSTYVLGKDKSYTPHNSFIYLGLASGIFPLALFIAFCVSMVRSRFSGLEVKDASFRKSLFVFTLMVSLVGDLSFMSPWGLLAFAPGLAAVAKSRVQRRVHFDLSLLQRAN
jgi:O-antigen ligase